MPVHADRILDGALACIARVGVAKTTLDDVAREAGCARATVYRCFPGRRALLRAVLDREIADLAVRLSGAASEADNLADAVVAVVVEAAAAFRAHAALAFVLAFEPELVAAQLSFDRGSALLLAAAALVAPAFTRFLPPARASRLGEWVARLTLAYLCNPSDRVQLDDPAHVRALVVNHILPSVIRTTSTFVSVTTGEGVSQ